MLNKLICISTSLIAVVLAAEELDTQENLLLDNEADVPLAEKRRRRLGGYGYGRGYGGYGGRGYGGYGYRGRRLENTNEEGQIDDDAKLVDNEADLERRRGFYFPKPEDDKDAETELPLDEAELARRRQYRSYGYGRRYGGYGYGGRYYGRRRGEVEQDTNTAELPINDAELPRRRQYGRGYGGYGRGYGGYGGYGYGGYRGRRRGEVEQDTNTAEIPLNDAELPRRRQYGYAPRSYGYGRGYGGYGRGYGYGRRLENTNDEGQDAETKIPLDDAELPRRRRLGGYGYGRGGYGRGYGGYSRGYGGYGRGYGYGRRLENTNEEGQDAEAKIPLDDAELPRRRRLGGWGRGYGGYSRGGYGRGYGYGRRMENTNEEGQIDDEAKLVDNEADLQRRRAFDSYNNLSGGRRLTADKKDEITLDDVELARRRGYGYGGYGRGYGGYSRGGYGGYGRGYGYGRRLENEEGDHTEAGEAAPEGPTTETPTQEDEDDDVECGKSKGKKGKHGRRPPQWARGPFFPPFWVSPEGFPMPHPEGPFPMPMPEGPEGFPMPEGPEGFPMPEGPEGFPMPEGPEGFPMPAGPFPPMPAGEMPPPGVVPEEGEGMPEGELPPPGMLPPMMDPYFMGGPPMDGPPMDGPPMGPLGRRLEDTKDVATDDILSALTKTELETDK